MGRDEVPSLTRAPRWRELGLLGKIARVTAFAFVTTYLTLAVAKALPGEYWLNQRVAPLAKKVAPLRLSSPWRMFVGEARFGYIVLQTETANGDLYEVESFRWEGKSWWDRARDSRLRKIQSKLKQKGQRKRWGHHYLSYVCETTMRELPDISSVVVIRGRPLILDENGKRRSRPYRQVIATFDCRTKRFTRGSS